MGCAQSRIDNEESVSRCKDRRNLMKDAVTARNAFAAGHSGYTVALKNTGAALSDYGHGEVLEESHDHNQHHDNHQSPLDPTSQTPQPPPPPPPPPPDMDPLPPSPPPLPEFSPSPLKRATSMPTMGDQKPGSRRRRHRQIGSGPIKEEDEEEEQEEGHNANVGKIRNEKNLDSKVGPQNTPDNNNNTTNINTNNNNDVRAPPPPPMPDATWDYFFSVQNIPSSSLDASENDDRNENEENSFEFDKIRINNNNNDDEVEPKTPEKVEKKVEVEVEVEKGKQIEHSNTAPIEFRRVAKTVVVSSVNLMQLLSAIDDNFLKASESAQEVSKMLEATRLHYHSNFADNRGNWIGCLF